MREQLDKVMRGRDQYEECLASFALGNAVYKRCWPENMAQRAAT
jgi:hypothetical protein